MTDEHTYFHDAGVRVTSARFIAGSQTIAMSGITAVRTLRHGLTSMQLLMLVGGGLLLALAHTATLQTLGAALLAYGLWRWWRPPYSVEITMASGALTVLTDRRRTRIHEIVDAVNDAIIHRA